VRSRLWDDQRRREGCEGIVVYGGKWFPDDSSKKPFTGRKKIEKFFGVGGRKVGISTSL